MLAIKKNTAKWVFKLDFVVEICYMCYYLGVMKNKKGMKSIFVFGGIVIGIVLVLFLSISVIPKALVVLTKASSSDKVVIGNSYVLGQKILAKADGKDNCIVNVFLLDKNGRGVLGKAAEVTGVSGIKKVNDVSDKMGKLTFEVTSSVEGQFKLKATFDGVELPQMVTVTFRK